MKHIMSQDIYTHYLDFFIKKSHICEIIAIETNEIEDTSLTHYYFFVIKINRNENRFSTMFIMMTSNIH